MMPCKRCGLYDSDGNFRKGLKRRGKTRFNLLTSQQIRRYRCQDCGVHVVTKVDSTTGTHWEEYLEPADAEAPVKSIWDHLKNEASGG